MAAEKPAPIQRDWFSKSLAGIVLGGVIALAASAVYLRLAGATAPPVRAQLAMWLVPPVWLGVMSFVYLARNGRRAWVGLSLLALGLWALALALRALHS